MKRSERTRRQWLTTCVATTVGLSALAGCTDNSDETDRENGAESSTNGSLDAGWRMYGVDLANTGHQSNASGPTEDVDVDWTFETGDSLAATPIIVDGILYVGSHDEHFYALDAENGDEEWSVDLGTSARRTPAYADGNIYISGSRELLSIDAETGEIRWREDGTDSNPYYPLIVDEETGIVTDDEYIWRFDPKTGSLEQVIDLLPDPFEMGVSGAPAIADGIAYVGYEDRLGAIDLETGEREWEFENETGEIFHQISPAVADGLVYIGDVDGNFYAVDAESGDLEWEYNEATEVASNPSVADGMVFFGDSDRVVALEVDSGNKEWEADVGPTPDVQPTATNETIYLAVHRFLYAVEAKTGNKIWSHEFGSHVDEPRIGTNYAMQAPPIIVDGSLYVTTSNNKIHKFKTR